jgi:hypothetical protein
MNQNRIVFFLLCLSLAVTLTGATTYSWRAGEVGRGTELNAAFATKMNAETPVISSSASVAAGATITVPVTNGLVLITNDSAGEANLLSLGAGSSGQMLFIYNGDASATSGIATISAGKIGMLVYANSGWRLVADE